MLSQAERSQNTFNIVAGSEKRKVLKPRRARLIRGKSGGLYSFGAGAEQTLL
jgi:hypothetical protein